MAKKYRPSSRKSGAFGKKKHRWVSHRRVLLPFVTTRVRRCQQVLSRAILLPSRHGLSSTYMTYLLRTRVPMAGIAQRLKAVSVISLRSQCRPRWVFRPYSFIAAPWRNPRLYNTQPHDITELKLCNSAKLWENSFAKYRTLRKNPQTQYSCGFADLFLQNDRFWKCLLTFWTTCYILYSSQILSVFAKYDTLRNFFMEKDAPRRPFVVFRVRPIGRQTTVAGALDAPPLLPYREKSRKG